MRYDGPHFEKKGFVSIWVSKVTLDEIPEEYFEERYGEANDDVPLSQWCENFRFGYYDHDQIEDHGVETDQAPLDKLLGECSFSLSYLDQAVRDAKSQGLESVSWIRNLFDFAYDSSATGIHTDAYMIYLGTYEYDSKAESKYGNLLSYHE